MLKPQINLQQFCGDDAYAERREIHRPFSADGLTWACNGHIAVRVPALPEYGPQKKPLGMKNIAAMIDGFDGDFTPMSLFDLPEFTEKTTKVECEECDGRGTEHDCPACTCTCDECGGKGSYEKTTQVSAGILGGIFNLKYLHMVAALPGAEIGVSKSGEIASFRFDGGDGALMGIWGEYKIHHALSPKTQAA